MRSFIAIELSETARSALSQLQQEFKKYGADVRWVKPDNIHFTLKFLGNIEEKDVGRVVKIIEGICSVYNAFSLELKGIGVFPNKRSPRVLWVGINGSGLLTQFQRKIEDGMVSLGFERESRKFTPHLTLGRFRSSTGKEGLLDKVELHKNDNPGLIEVKAILLMRSDLNPTGARYTKIAEIPLGK